MAWPSWKLRLNQCRRLPAPPRRSYSFHCEPLEPRRMLAGVTWDFALSEPELPLGWRRGGDPTVEPFPWTIENGSIVGRTAGEGAEFWQDNSWIETPVIRFGDADEASIEFRFQHNGFIPGTDTFLDCLIVTLQDPTDSDGDSTDSNCSSGEQLLVFEHVASAKTDQDVEHDPFDAEEGKGYRLRFRASDYDQSASNDGIRISGLSITGIVAESDLVIEVSASPGPFTAGEQPIQYDVRISNYGPVDANNVVVTEDLGPGLTRTSTTCPGGIATNCAIGQIPSGTLVNYTVSATTSRQLAGTAVSTFEVDSATFDQDSSNNTASGTTTIVRPPNAPPVANDDEASTTEDSPVRISTTTLLVNDTDIDGDTLSVLSIDDSLSKGTVSLIGAFVTYDPNDQFTALGTGETATDTFAYTIGDGRGGTNAGTVRVTVSGQATDRLPGDSNSDGIFNSADLILVLQAGEFDDGIPNNSTFEEGDWNGDGDFTTADMILVLQLGHFDQT